MFPSSCRAGAAEFIFKRASFTSTPDDRPDAAAGPQPKKRKQAQADPEPGNLSYKKKIKELKTGFFSPFLFLFLHLE